MFCINLLEFYIKSDPYVQFLASRGYVVFQPNFRGSTGYGAKHYILANKQFGKTMQDDITDGVKFLTNNGFQLYTELFDYSFDNMNYVDRLNFFIDECKKVLNTTTLQ